VLTSPCTDSNELLKYDETIRSTLSSTLNIELTENGWRQAVLPVKWGGLGICSIVQLTTSAYMASAAGPASMLFNILPQRLRGVLDISMILTTLALNKITECVDSVPVSHGKIAPQKIAEGQFSLALTKATESADSVHVSHGKIAPQTNSRGANFLADGDRETFAPRSAIYARSPSVRKSPLGDLFTIAVCEKIAPYCLIVRNSPLRRRLFEWGRFFSRGD